MARPKNTTNKDTKTKATEVEKKVEDVAIEEAEVKETSAAPAMDNAALLEMLAGLQAQVASLTAELNKKDEEIKEIPAKVEQKETSSDVEAKDILNYLTNKKSDREVTIVHNQELMGGLTTHIDLTGLAIDFRTMGEQRVLSWQQFEECVSKYRGFFERHVILLAPEHRDLAEKYNVPYLNTNGQTITRNDLRTLGNMPIDKLETYFSSLLPEDQDFICSYWLGKCYERADGYYDRYKVELLNRLNGNRVFDNILLVMNGDFQRD